MKPLKITTETLNNGFRIVAIDLPGRRSITNFLAIRSGSRYEDTKNSGIAHFLEHLVFKGTKKYANNEEVASAIESIGGTLNAWTDFDHTAYWNIVPAASAQVGLEMPFELAFEPLIKDEDIERERGVILEEIRMVQDDPARFVHDISTELLFEGNPLGRPIIGTEDHIRAMTPAQFREYRDNFYIANHAVFVVAGDLSDGAILSSIKERAQAVKSGKLLSPEMVSGPSKSAVRLLEKATDQTHFVLACSDPDLGLDSTTDRHTLTVLNTILGRGMSSRLFLNVREKRGLAYAIGSQFSTLEDVGTLSIYGGVNTEKLTEALEATRDELRRLQDELVEARELQNAQNYINGSSDMQADQGMQLAMWYGTDWLLGRYETHEEVAAGIRAVTAEQIQELARRIFDSSRLTLAIIGPHNDASPFAELLSTK